MAANNDTPSLSDLFSAAPKDFRHYLQGQVIRKAGDIQGKQDFTAHRIHVAHGIGRCDSPINVGVIHNGREEVDRLNEGPLTVNLVDSGIISRTCQPNQQIRVLKTRKRLTDRTQDLRQYGETRLTGSTGAGCQRGQPDLLAGHCRLLSRPLPSQGDK